MLAATPKTRTTTFWLWIALGLVVLALLAPAVVGCFLSSEYTAVVERTIARGPREVWAAVVDVPAHPLSGARARSVESLGEHDGGLVWREDLGDSRLTVRAEEREEPERVLFSMGDDENPMFARWEVALRPVEDGATLVRIETDYRILGGGWQVPYFRFVMRFFDGAAMGAESYLERLQATLEGAAARDEG